MGWAAITAAMGDSAPAGGWSSGMHPPFLFCLAKRETGRARSKEKNAWRTPVRWPSVRTGVGVSVQAPIWPCLRARYSLLQVCNCRPVADGAEVVGVVIALNCFSFRCRWSGGQQEPVQRADEGIRPYGDTAGPARRGRPVCRPLQERQPQRRGRCPQPPESIDPYDHPGSA